MRGIRDKAISSPPWAPGPGSTALLLSLSAWSFAIGVATNSGDSVTMENGATVVLAAALVIVLTLTALAIARTVSSLTGDVVFARILVAGCLVVVPVLYLSPINVGRAAVRVRLPRSAGFALWGVTAVSVILLVSSANATS